MCLILFAYRASPDRPLVVAANRDEFYARPALGARCWEDDPNIFGGRDLEAHGTWLAASQTGRFAAVTNFTDTDVAERPPGSRGDLPRYFLKGTMSAREYVDHLDGGNYQGFNLIAFDGAELVYTSNRTGDVRVLAPGTYGLTNTRLGDEWPKTTRGAAALKPVADTATTDDLLTILRDDSVADEHTQRASPARLRRAAPCFIKGEKYGTRASTAVIFSNSEKTIEFVEQLYGPYGKPGERVARTLKLDANRSNLFDLP